MIIECKKKPKDYEPVKGNETKIVIHVLNHNYYDHILWENERPRNKSRIYVTKFKGEGKGTLTLKMRDEKNEMSKCMYMQLRLTISDFEKIPQKLICNEIKKAASRTYLVEYSTWREKVMYDGRIMSFTMLVFEVKKNILSKWRGLK